MTNAKRDSNTEKRDTKCVTPSRARALLRRDVTVSRRDNSRDVTRSSRDSQPPEGAAHHGRRFDAWLAGASPEQAKRWKRMQAVLAADPVQDDQLPPALRGGALEVF